MKRAAALVWVVLAAAACDGAPPREGQSHPSRLRLRGVADLPFSQGKSFRTLDGYLAHLESRGRSDVPHYEEVRPGMYALRPGLPRPAGEGERLYTREELAQLYGFGHRRPISETVDASRCVPEPAIEMTTRSLGARFRTFDELLKHLDKSREYDGSSYELVAPDTYELIPNWVSGPPPEGYEPQRFTREQLLCRYGFIR
jgi:hypothetical protein